MKHDLQSQDESRSQERHPVRNAAAAVMGAAQGLKESLKEEHLLEEAERAMHNLGQLARSASMETRRQWQSPEIEELRRDVARGGGKARHGIEETSTRVIGETNAQAKDAMAQVKHATAQVKQASGTAVAEVRHRGVRVKQRVQETVRVVPESVGHGIEEVRHTTADLVTEGKHRVRAVKQSARRAARAPAHIQRDLKAAAGSYAKGLTQAMAMYLLVGVLAATAFIVLTIGSVLGLNALLGVPAGHFIVAVVYGAAAGGLIMVTRRRREEKREETAEHVEDARREVRHVSRPVRQAFGNNHR